MLFDEEGSCSSCLDILMELLTLLLLGEILLEVGVRCSNDSKMRSAVSEEVSDLCSCSPMMLI